MLLADDEEQPHQARVKLRACAADKLFHCLVGRALRLVDPLGGHGIEGIYDGDNTRAQWDIVTCEATWIPPAIPAFVMVVDE